MFGSTIKNEKISLEKIDTLISKNVKIDGEITSVGTVRLDCKVTGNVKSEGLIIGETGEIKGDISCDEIIVSGKVEGKISCKNKMHIKETGSQIGDVEVGLLIIDEGANFEGNCLMKKNAPPKMQTTTNSNKDKN